MYLRRTGWSRLALSVGLTVAVAFPALGQTSPPPLPERPEILAPAPAGAPSPGPVPPAPVPPVPTAGTKTGGSDPLSPRQLISGPSLYETGRVGIAPTATPTAIEPQDELSARREKSIGAAADIDTPPAQRPGALNPQQLDREVEARFAALENCRIDAARIKRVPPAKITANVLTLRWTIQPSGDVTATAVVATTPVDLEVMDCVKSTMSRWRFTGPRGGPVEVERRFSFRALH